MELWTERGAGDQDARDETGAETEIAGGETKAETETETETELEPARDIVDIEISIACPGRDAVLQERVDSRCETLCDRNGVPTTYL